MILRRIHLRNFRNYGEVELFFSEQCNFILGNNAQGKSNLLEAIHVLALTRSFRTTRERDLAGYDGDGYEILGEFSDEAGVTHLVAVCYRQHGGKEVALDRKRLQSSGLIGKFPVVHFSPESHRITSGPPAERRRFIDMLLCQCSPSYFANLVEYNRILRQRNALLTQPMAEREKNLTAWSQSLAYHGCRVISARYQFVNEYAPVLHQAYAHISVSAQPCQLIYRSQIELETNTPEQFLRLLMNARVREEQKKRTLLGPHLDDLEFCLAGRDLKHYGSRGEHKTALIALKLSEAEYMKAKTGTAPIILLDDLSSELDQNRMHSALKYFHGWGQLFVTSVIPLPGDVMLNHKRYEVTNGHVQVR